MKYVFLIKGYSKKNQPFSDMNVNEPNKYRVSYPLPSEDDARKFALHWLEADGGSNFEIIRLYMPESIFQERFPQVGRGFLEAQIQSFLRENELYENERYAPAARAATASAAVSDPVPTAFDRPAPAAPISIGSNPANAYAAPIATGASSEFKVDN